MMLTCARPALRSVEDSQDDYLLLVNFVDGDEGERRKRNLARALNANDAPQVRKRLQCPDALDNGLHHASRGVKTFLCDVVADPFEIVRGIRRPAGRASAAITPIDASSHIIVVDQPAFTCGGATVLDFAAEPLVMVHRAG